MAAAGSGSVNLGLHLLKLGHHAVVLQELVDNLGAALSSFQILKVEEPWTPSLTLINPHMLWYS